MPLTIPTIHLNGSGRKSLVADYEAALSAVRAAQELLYATAPNGRDYYTQGVAAISRATDEHRARLEHLEVVISELTEILIAIND